MPYIFIHITVLIIIIGIFIIIFLLKKRLQDREIARLECEKRAIIEDELKVELEYKTKQMISHALNMVKKNQFISDLEKSICEIQENSDEKVNKELQKLAQNIKRQDQSKNDWELFKNYFEDVNRGFYDNLSQKFPGLSPGEYKLCALIKLNLNIKESAGILKISPRSVKTARHRLRKKLSLDQQVDLHEFIQSI